MSNVNSHKMRDSDDPMSTAQAPNPKNFFALFGFEPSFDIDCDHLETAYIQESAKWHPDQNPHASSREKMQRTLFMATLNDAYKALKSPLDRGYHLLSLHAPELCADQEQTIKDPELLQEALEDQETLDEIHSADQLEGFYEAAQSKYDHVLTIISAAFHNKNYQEARLFLYRLRYYQKVLKDAQAKRSQLKHSQPENQLQSS